MRWHRPRPGHASMTVKIAVLLILALVVIGGMTAWWVVRTQGAQTGQEFERRLGDQLAAIVTLMDETPAAERPALLGAISSPLFAVGLQDTARGFVPATGEARKTLDTLSAGILKPIAHRTLRVHIPKWDDTKNRMTDTKLAVRLRDGRWLTFAIPAYITDTIWTSGGVLSGLGWLIIIIVIIFVIAKWMSRPLRQFTDAAERLGRDLNAPPLKPHGGPELRRAATAFNGMQTRLKRYLDDRTLMLAAISHDLRSYLTRLRLRVEFLEGAERDKAVRDLEDMERILDDTLDFARDEAAREETVPTDLSALVAERVARFAEDGAPVTLASAPSLTIAARPMALARAIDNLIGNAVHYGNEARVSLTREGQMLRLQIRDMGEGIPESEWEEVFRPFYRRDHARTLSEDGGSGLGLAIARSNARAHGGDIRFARDAEGFSTILELPA